MILPPDIPVAFTAFAKWMTATLYILLLNKRLKGIRLWAAIIVGGGVFFGYHYLSSILPTEFWVPCWFGAAVLIYGYVLLCAKTDVFSCGSHTSLIFLAAEFIASLEWQLHVFLRNNYALWEKPVMQGLLFVVLYAVFFGLLCFVERRYLRNSEMQSGIKDFFVATVTTLIICVVSNISFLSIDTPISGKYPTEIMYIRTLVDFCGILLLYVQKEQKLWLRAKTEADMVQGMLTRQYEQYCVSKETIENINRNYHDLKHQIIAIRAESDPEKRAAYLDNIENEIKMYEAQNKTGNPVLDILLTGKSMFCVEHNINFTCVADGALLHFMSVVDLCSLFGNALDNAIESVMKLTEEKRLIKLAVYQQNDFLLIQVKNYFDGALEYRNGQLVTSKNDKLNHGFGIKSIRQVAEKYEGELKITAEDNWFSLLVIMPLAERKHNKTTD